MISKFIYVFLATIVGLTSAKLDPACTQAAPSGVDPKSCCSVPDFLDETIIEKCATKVMGLKRSSEEYGSAEMESSGLCFGECVFNETGINKNGEVQINVIKQILQDAVKSDRDWTPIVSAAVDTCDALCSKMPKANMEKKGECGPKPAFLIGCISTQLFKSCPASKWKESNGCAQLKKNADQCPILTAIMQHNDE